jgi:tryptophan synthase alpha chain
MIFLVAPTSTDARLKLVAERASGFIYAVSRAGVTGAREAVSRDAERLVERVRKFSDLPVAVGFGISTASQVAETWRYADAAVVGSAIVAGIERLKDAPDLDKRVGEFAHRLLPSSGL